VQFVLLLSSLHKKLRLWCLILFTVLSITPPAFAYWTPPIRITQPGTFYRPQVLFDGQKIHIIEERQTPHSYISYQSSVDFGDTWSSEFRISSYSVSTSAANPSFLILNNNLYVSWISFDNQGIYRQNVGFRRSTNLGTTWIADHEVLQDDIEGVIDQAMGLARDFIYVVYCASYNSDTVQFYFVKSTDNGTTWSNPQLMFSAGDISFSKSLSFGDTIHFFWDGQLARPGPVNCYYTRSTDGGNSWSQNRNLRNYNGSLSDWPGLAQNEDGLLLTHWMDFRYSNYGLTGDIFVRKSSDFGEGFDDEVQVTAHHRAMSSKAVFQADSVIMSYDDWRYGDWREISLIRSTNSGDNWFGDERVSFLNPLDSYDPSIAVADSHIFMAWATRSESDPNPPENGTYFTRYDVFQPDGIDEEMEPEKEGVRIVAYPNPFNSNINIDIDGAVGCGDMAIEIYDIKGALIKKIKSDNNDGGGRWKLTWDATDASGKRVSSGIYFARASTDQGEAMIILNYVK
jgi:hypothetical protein